MELIEIGKYNASAEWMILVFLTVLFIIAWVKNTYPKRFFRLLRSLINKQSLFQIMREELMFSHRGSIALTFNFIIIMGLFLTISTNVYNLSIFFKTQPLIAQFGYWILLVILIYFVKWLINGLFFSLIQQRELFQSQMFIISIFNKAIGLIILPITILATYLPLNSAMVLIKIGFFTWAILLIYRIIKEASISLTYKIHWLYIILYLCAFEISPFVVGIKMVKMLDI